MIISLFYDGVPGSDFRRDAKHSIILPVLLMEVKRSIEKSKREYTYETHVSCFCFALFFFLIIVIRKWFFQENMFFINQWRMIKRYNDVDRDQSTSFFLISHLRVYYWLFYWLRKLCTSQDHSQSAYMSVYMFLRWYF